MFRLGAGHSQGGGRAATDSRPAGQPGDRERRGRQLDGAVAAFHRRPLNDIYRALVLDGVVLRRKTGAGALAALPTAYPEVPVQRCWAHKIRNVLNKACKADQATVKASLLRIMNASTLPQARAGARRFADRREGTCPKAVACLCADLDDLLTCVCYPTLEQRNAGRAGWRRSQAVRRVRAQGRMRASPEPGL